MFKNILFYIILTFFAINCDSKSDQPQSIPKVQNVIENNETSLYLVDIVNSEIKWIGKKITSSHEGTIRLSSGKIKMNGNHVQSAELIVDMTTIQNTDIENEKYRKKLNGHLRNEDFFNVEKYSTSVLKINNSQKLEDSNFRFFGELTIKGITHPVEFDGIIEKNEDILSANIKLIFDRTLWGIKYGSGKFFDDLGDRMILDNIELKITIQTL